MRHLLRRQANTRVLMGEVTAVDPARKVVMLDAAPIAYDYLVLATGATHGYFGRDEWAVHAPGLKTLDDATAIRRRLLLAFERAEMASNPEESARLLTVVIVGGGPTGVELAGAVAELTRRALARDFRVIDPTRTRVLLVESGPRLLANFPEALSRYTATALGRLGVEVRLGTPVTHCDAEGVRIGDERIDAATVIWAAGVRASPAAALARHRRRSRRARARPAGSHGAGASGRLRHRRHRLRKESGRRAAARHRAGRETAGRLRRAGTCGAHRRARSTRGVRLSRPRASRDYRPARRRDCLQAAATLGLDRVVDLGRRPRVLPREPAQPR